MSTKTKILSDFMDVTTRIDRHVDGYINHVKGEIEYQLLEQLEDLESDYFTSEDDKLDKELKIAFKGIKGHLAHVCDNLKDTVNAFYDHAGDSEYASCNEMDEEIEEILEKYEDESSFVEDEDLDKHGVYDKLKSLSESYHLSDHQLYQDEILRILEDEFNLKLVCLPAKNK